jgi:hypothetical protein
VPDRLRDLAERPLDRRLARAVLILGLAVTVGASLVLGLAALGRGGGSSATTSGRIDAPGPAAPSVATTPGSPTAAAKPAPIPLPEQDPQDRTGSAARRRAVAEVESHRALQHVPYRHGGVTVALVGARGSRAVLRVTAPTTEEARKGWSSFLRRFHDHGAAYLPLFRGGRGRG